MFTPKNRDRLTEVVRDEIDSIQAQINTTWLKEHAEDGSHRFPAGDVVPVGFIGMWASDTVPNSKWLFCRGQQVSRSIYQALFNIFGITYGAGDGSTTFNLPDLQQRFPLGKAAAGTGSSLGNTGGAIDHVHTGPSHTHSIGSSGDHSHSITADGGHDHGGVTGVPNDSGISVDHNLDGSTIKVATHPVAPLIAGHGHPVSAASDHSHGGVTGDAGEHDHGGATGSAGTGNTGANNPPYLVLNYVVFSGVAVN